MKDKMCIRLVLYSMPVVIFTGLLLFTFHDRSDIMERQQIQVVTLGDSALALSRDETSIPAQLEDLLGKSVYCAAFGGTCVSRIDKEYRMDYAKDALSLVALSKALAVDDFGVQQTVRIRESNTEYFSAVVDGLELTDFSGVEIVVILHGLNDFYNGVPIYNPDDPFDEYTFSGALRSSVAFLRQGNPDVRIVLATPTYTWHLQSGLTCEEYNAGFGVEEDYIQAEIELAEELGLELVDLYHDMFPHEKWEDWERYTFDGLHPNEAGRELLARAIAERLQ